MTLGFPPARSGHPLELGRRFQKFQISTLTPGGEAPRLVRLGSLLMPRSTPQDPTSPPSRTTPTAGSAPDPASMPAAESGSLQADAASSEANSRQANSAADTSIDDRTAGMESGTSESGAQGIEPLAHEDPDPSTGVALPLDPELQAELPAFEQFFKTFGFKRMHGRVWGLLVLSRGPLSSKDICEQLEISQGAASTTLTELLEWGAITRNFDSSRRCHVHGPVGNALSIAATILHRREQVAFQQFRLTAERSRNYIAKRYGERDPRVLTLRSIIAACEIADALMKLLVGTVANALGDSQSLLSRAIHAALRVGLPAPNDSVGGLFAQALDPNRTAGIDLPDVDLDDESERDAADSTSASHPAASRHVR